MGNYCGQFWTGVCREGLKTFPFPFPSFVQRCDFNLVEWFPFNVKKSNPGTGLQSSVSPIFSGTLSRDGNIKRNTFFKRTDNHFKIMPYPMTVTYSYLKYDSSSPPLPHLNPSEN